MIPKSGSFIGAAVVAAAVAATLAGCSRAEGITATAEVPSESVRLAIDGASNSSASVAAAGARVALTWAATSGTATNVYAAMSQDGGVTFGTPVRVNDVDGDVKVSGEQAPRTALGGQLVVTWLSKLDGTSHLRMARSMDEGRTFLPATTPHAADLSGARGWASLTLDRQGLIHEAWLDGRNAHAGDAAHAAAGHAAADHEHAMRQDIFHAIVRPDGSRDEARVATDVCFCCKTSVAAAGDGTTYVAWRHVYPTNLRDIAIAHSTDGGRTFSDPVRVSEDHWQIDGCPEDGPSIAVTADGVLHVVWPTLINQSSNGQGRKAIFYSFSTDGGRTFAPRVRLDRDDDGSILAAHPQIAVVNAHVEVVWDESVPEGHRIRARQIMSHSDVRGWMPVLEESLIVSGDEPASYPAIAGTPAGAVIAWTVSSKTGSQIRVRQIRN